MAFRVAKRVADGPQELRVNPIRCAAFGFCAEHSPELVALDPWGYAWLRQRDVPTDLVALAEQTVALCPTRAILLTARAARTERKTA